MTAAACTTLISQPPAISGFGLWLLILFALPETLRARVGNGKIYEERGLFFWPPTLSSPLAPSSARGPPPPVPTLKGYWRLFVYPPIGIVTFNTAMLYSTYFAIAVQLPIELADRYHWSSAAVGAGFLAVGIAMIVGSLCGGRFSDWRRSRAAKTAPDGKVDPEFRLADQIWGVLVCVAGCVMFGWLNQISAHPAAVLFATFLSEFPLNSLRPSCSSVVNDFSCVSWLRHELGLRHDDRVSHRVCGPTGCWCLCSW
jgi:uncharacterized membrane protein YgdD (TMEM256/DUF423 family)